jgi:peptidoglycan/LPS O-acetylase OafA/YrhL
VDAPPFGSVDGLGSVDGPGARLLFAGKYGVEVFFAISGFVLALPFLGARLGKAGRVSTGRYFLRRLTRLEPPYLAALGLWLVAGLAVSSPDPGGLLSHSVVGAGYLHGDAYGTENPVLGVAWSLEVEIRFYLVVPLLAWALGSIASSRIRRQVVVMLGALSLITAAWTDAGWVSALWYTPFFLAGWLAADLYVVDPRWRTESRYGDVATVAGSLGCLAIFASGNFPLVLRLGPLAVWVLLIGVLRGRRTRRVLSHRLLTTAGAASYSIYLIHYPVLLLWARAGAPRTLWLALVGVLIASLAFYVAIERPCMDPLWPSRVWARVKAVPTASPVAPQAEGLSTSAASTISRS